MLSNSRFAVSVHILSFLTHKQGNACSSAEIAGSVNTNAVVIRRLLSSLARARLVTSQKGAGGGFLLASAPENITLLDVYRAVEPTLKFGLEHFDPNMKCPIGSKIQATIEKILFRAQTSLEAELARQTIADVHREVRPLCGSKP